LCAAGFGLVSALCVTTAPAATPDDDFLAAREAFRVGDVVRFERAAKSLNDHPLEPYIAYWRLRMRLEQATPEEVQALPTRSKDGPAANSLRTDWLKLLANRQQWEQFDAEFAQYVGDDAELSCLALQNRARSGNLEALEKARALWFSGRDQPETCSVLFDVLAERKMLSEADVWARIRLALEIGNTGVARRVAEYLPAKEQPDGATLSRIAVNPQAYLDKKAFNLKTRAGRETLMFAVQRLARSSPQIAAQHWTRLAEQVDEADRGYVWGLIAYQGAQRLDPAALGWYAKAGKLSDAQLAWKVRIALRALNWNEVLSAINAMSPTEAQDPAWRYWKARALKATGREVEALALLKPLSQEYLFYGQLALEELGGKVSAPPPGYTPTAADLQAMSQHPGIRRALALYALGMRVEANREWAWVIRDFDDRKLLAAAEVAKRADLPDRVINTADKTQSLHDFRLRYYAPYHDLLKVHAARQGLDEAWVLGLIRQESRFIADIRSSAGAMGLMQLMPGTAQWVAGKMGLKNWRWGNVTDVDTNLSLGTYYLRHVYDYLDSNPALASAAYNAGPGRARAWRPDRAMETAAWAETIPFNETRHYVKLVMANASYYASLLSQQVQSLKSRIGEVGPARPAEKSLGDTP